MFFEKAKGESQPTYGVQLLFNNGKFIKAPSESDLEKALQYIEEIPLAWITVSRGVVDFVTVTTCEEGGFNLEYEMGTRDNHQRINAPPLSTEQVLKMLVRYSHFRDDSFYEGWDWQRVPISEVDLRKAPRVVHGDIWNDPEEKG